ncbi:hypothetical protein [Bifidobacterium callitrichidarum]|uniref:Uncharacterized protein n=1 Tax=Bifidobacterium callitrichidarum TaxID=2052941 RepID=A0A2U2MZ44_9BIFI|nr:hypothetical protein [Bifidobacterium callitrichidarum]PWG62082.1 hypothetical protein DF196_12710 [Bifidobacterium callitrichidarum]
MSSSVCIELENITGDTKDGAWTIPGTRRTWIYPEDINDFEEALINAGCSQTDEDSDSSEYTVQVSQRGESPYEALRNRLKESGYGALLPPLPAGFEQADCTITLYY